MSESETSLSFLKSPPSLSESKLWNCEDIASASKQREVSSSSSAASAYYHQNTKVRPSLAPLDPNLSIRNEVRPHNTSNFVPDPETMRGGGVAFGMDGSSEQEPLLVQEVLNVLAGAQSWLIQVHEAPNHEIGFSVDPRVEHSLKELTLQIAQTTVHYHAVTRFVEKCSKFQNGQVNQALGSALKHILKDYFILLSQIETMNMKGELSLQKMLFFLHPTLQVLSILSSITTEIEKQNARGGTVLSFLHEKAVSMVGDATGQNLCYELAQRASAPYFIILDNWIYKGMIKDPFEEFFVLDTDKEDGLNSFKMEVNDNDNYWENRYKVVPDKCPSFLKSVDSEILKAGKYLNVIRQCGKDISIAATANITYSIHERVYVSAIEKAYAFASKTLMDLLLNEYDLMRRLQSVKHYLLMDQGDFIVQFLDLTEIELNKQIDDINLIRLKSLLELALRTSSASTDPYKDCVRVQLFPYGIAEQVLTIISIATPLEQKKISCDDFNFRIPGFEGFSFSYAVQWPISLVLNARIIACYQMIFRHLFYCKHIERQLCKVWIAKKAYKKTNLKEDLEKAAAFSLHQQMLNFVQNLQYYMAFEVIEPAWHNFFSVMAKATNVDQVLDYHVGMVNTILQDSMLISPVLLAKMTALLSLCLQFSDKLLTGAGDAPQKLTPFSNLNISVDEITSQFNKELVEFLKEVTSVVQAQNQASKVANIIYRVNFNGFYTEALEK